MTGAAEELFRLQVEQFQHDEKYHREIARLTVQHRLNHMALHLAKYLGVVAAAAKSQSDGEILARTIIDSFIITLSTANILNLRLSDRLIEGTELRDVSALASQLAQKKQVDRFDPGWLLIEMAIPVGLMAKACESYDHMEAFAFRETLVGCVVQIAELVLIAMAAARIDPAPAVRGRLRGVKERSIFHGHL